MCFDDSQPGTFMVSEMHVIDVPMHATGCLEKLADSGPPVPIEHLYNLMDVIDAIAPQTGRSVPRLP
jgi:hypothetical protein